VIRLSLDEEVYRWGMIENLRFLYRHYGGVGALISSYYFWFAFAFTFLSFQAIHNGTWTQVALAVLPSLTGFTIAAFAIIFAILDRRKIEILLPFQDGVSPIVSIAASISHAVGIQIFAILISIIYELNNVDEAIFFVNSLVGNYELKLLVEHYFQVGSIIFSFIGMFLTYYGIFLVLAAVLSVFRIQLSAAKKSKSGDSKK